MTDDLARRLSLTDPRTADPDAPVVIRFAAMGDVVLLSVLLHALAERHGRAVHVLGSGAWTPVLLGNDPAVSELRLVRSRRAPYWLTPSQWSAVAWLRAHRGPVLLCESDPHAARLVQRAGVPAQRLLKVWDHWPGDAVHWADWWLDMARRDPPEGRVHPGLAPLATPARPVLAVPRARWQAEAVQWLAGLGLGGRPLVLLQPGHKKTHKRGRLATAGHDKHWPAQHWATVAAGIVRALPGALVMVCGSPREAGLAQDVVNAADALLPPSLARGTAVVNGAALGLPLPRLAGLAALAHSMVSVDTGPAHVAGAMDCPLVVLYGQFGWGRWRVRSASAPVQVMGPQRPAPGARLLDISPAQVLQAWQQVAASALAQRSTQAQEMAA